MFIAVKDHSILVRDVNSRFRTTFLPPLIGSIFTEARAVIGEATWRLHSLTARAVSRIIFPKL
jgi:uncharacterized protein (DUF2236 family)